MMKMPVYNRETVILCEGYHDRAFWVGWLTNLGVKNLGRGNHLDPRGERVKAPQFAFAKGDTFLRLVPCERDQLGEDARRGGEEGVLDALTLYLNKAKTAEPPIAAVVVNLDDDGYADELKGKSKEQRIEKRITDSGYSLTKGANGIWQLDEQLRVAIVLWHTPLAPPHDHLPDKQTLERLVCSGIADAYPLRAKSVSDWLHSRPEPPASSSPKAHAWAHMAGWYALGGCERFLIALWEDDSIRASFERRLRESGDWTRLESLL